MQPLKPTERQAILENRPNAQPADVEEYERLLSERFTIDPDFAPAPAPMAERFAGARQAEDREERIAQLHRKLFGNTAATAATESDYASAQE